MMALILLIQAAYKNIGLKNKKNKNLFYNFFFSYFNLSLNYLSYFYYLTYLIVTKWQNYIKKK
jgi:hypothetical protein